MKVFISADMEGISGIVSEEETFMGRSLYPTARLAMTRDVNAAVEGALEGGAIEIVVNDCHYSGLNIDPEELRPEARLIRGQPFPIMVSGLDDSFNAVFLIGYHAMKGTACAILDHTYTSQFVEIRINGRSIGEMGLASAAAGEFGIPVALVTGDDKTALEAREFAPGAEVVVTKKAMGRISAECLSPETVRREIRDKAGSFLDHLGGLKPFRLEPPLKLEMEFVYTTTADRAINIPGVERTGGRSVAATLASVQEVGRLISAFSYFL